MYLLPQTADERLARVLSNIKRFTVPTLCNPEPPNGKRLIICGFGPSLEDTWPDVAVEQKKGALIMTTSGAHDFLIERGVIPNLHIECDPREHKVFFVRNSHPDVIYNLSSACHPEMFELLIAAGRSVRMWHGYTDDDIKRQITEIDKLQPGMKMICGGTNAGMRAPILGAHLGFRDLHLHAMDCSYRDGETWAGPHSGSEHYRTYVRCNGKLFETSDVMLASAEDFFNLLPVLTAHGCAVAVHGGGLLNERVNLVNRWIAEASKREWYEVVAMPEKKAEAA